MAKYSIKKVQSNDDNGYQGEIVTVTDLKNYLQIEGTAYDGPLARFITSARQMIERFTNVSLYPKTYKVEIKTFHGDSFPLPYAPHTGVTQVAWRKCPSTVIQLDEGTQWGIVDDGSDQYEIWANREGTFYVTYESGANDASIFQQAILAQAAYSFNNRDSDLQYKIAPEAAAIVNAVRQHTY